MINTKDIAKIKFEAALSRITEIVAKLEGGNSELDETVSLYEEGIILLHSCEDKLKNAKLRIEEIDNRDYNILLKGITPKKKVKEKNNKFSNQVNEDDEDSHSEAVTGDLVNNNDSQNDDFSDENFA